MAPVLQYYFNSIFPVNEQYFSLTTNERTKFWETNRAITFFLEVRHWNFQAATHSGYFICEFQDLLFFFNKTIAVPIPRMSKYGGSIHAPVTLDNNGWHQFEWINQSTRRNWHSAARHVVASPCRYFRWDKPKPPEPEVLLWRTTANTVVTDKSVLLQREDGKRSPNSKPPSIPCWCSEARYPFQLQIRLIRYHAPHGQELSLNASMLHLHDWSWIMPFSSQFLRHSEVCVPGLFRTINANS
jgi:hypothetical protein